METIRSVPGSKLDSTLYSLEKLIEWKLRLKVASFRDYYSLYSLEKLIEWKLNLRPAVILAPVCDSLLAREIN